MFKKLFVILNFGIILIGCSQEEEKAKIGIKEVSKIEKRLRTQLEEYTFALNSGDSKLALSYLYPDLLEWTFQQAPVNYTKDDVKNMFADEIISTNEDLIKQNINLSYEIGDITNKMDLGLEKIYTVIFYVIRKEGFKETKAGEEIIAITIDNGENWKFLSTDPESDEILKSVLGMKFSEEVVNRILNK